MKTKFLYIAALATMFVFSGCNPQEPFDTQSPDDAPLILRPYNESGTGSFTYLLANPDTPLYDSVTVTPSAYTKINWYLDGELVYTGEKINMCFYAGTYALTIEAVTDAGKRTTRTGTVVVNPYDNDPYSAAPAIGRHAAPAMVVTIDGQNMNMVKSVALCNDLFGIDIAMEVNPDSQTADALTFTVPALPNGAYHIRLRDADGKLYGADVLNIYNEATVLDGYAEFIPGEEWTITGLNLQNVASVKLGENVVTSVTATASSVTFTAPAVDEGKYTLSMLNQDGTQVKFVTEAGLVNEVIAQVSTETIIWSGSVDIAWDADLVKVESSVMAAAPIGATIFVYYSVIDAEYHALRVTTPWWNGDLLPQVDGMESQANPYPFEYTDACKALVDETGAMSVVGFGLNVTKITYK
ncbi:MAG: IPT/TIG domain-containing protein [Paludibacteraceae bacterium]|nr:IPT/TIG domain-containing protein [Paludibacteraceae bacterium]